MSIDVDRKPIDRERAVLDFVEAHRGITNKDARMLLGIANTTANQLLKKMTDSEKLVALGERRHRVYVLPELKPDAK